MNNKISRIFPKQTGAALLVFFLLIFSVAATVLLTALNNRSPSLQKKEKIHNEMALAKEALLAYAFNYPDLFPTSNNGPGRFPCTDSTNNGQEDCLISGARLPESLTIQSEDPSQVGGPFQLVDTYAGIDQQFWYFISPSFARNTATQLNSTTTPLFTLDNQNDIVAVLIAPGDPISTQDRGSNPNSPLHYLEASNQSGSNFSNSNPSNPGNFNDQVLGITRSELMSLVTVRVAIELKAIFDEFHFNSGAYPIDIATTSEALTGNLVPQYTDNANFVNGLPAGNSASPGISSWFYTDAWDLLTSYDYDTDPDIIHFSFANCAMIFTLNFDSNLEISPKRC